METIAPDLLPRRSAVYRRLLERGARFTQRGVAAVAESFGDPGAEAVAARVLGLCDLSPLERCGFKGAGTADWIVRQGVVVPEVNRIARHTDGTRVVRLGPNDVLLLPDPRGHGALVRELPGAWDAQSGEPGARGFPVPRADGLCWFLACGEHVPSLLAKLCAVDLRLHRFATGNVAQTQVAGLSAVVARDDLGRVPAFHLLADNAAATYWWDCFMDAMREFAGRPIGLGAVCGLED